MCVSSGTSREIVSVKSRYSNCMVCVPSGTSQEIGSVKSRYSNCMAYTLGCPIEELNCLCRGLRCVGGSHAHTHTHKYRDNRHKNSLQLPQCLLAGVPHLSYVHLLEFTVIATMLACWCSHVSCVHLLVDSGGFGSDDPSASSKRSQEAWGQQRKQQALQFFSSCLLFLLSCSDNSSRCNPAAATLPVS